MGLVTSRWNQHQVSRGEAGDGSQTQRAKIRRTSAEGGSEPRPGLELPMDPVWDVETFDGAGQRGCEVNIDWVLGPQSDRTATSESEGTSGPQMHPSKGSEIPDCSLPPLQSPWPSQTGLMEHSRRRDSDKKEEKVVGGICGISVPLHKAGVLSGLAWEKTADLNLALL